MKLNWERAYVFISETVRSEGWGYRKYRMRLERSRVGIGGCEEKEEQIGVLEPLGRECGPDMGLSWRGVGCSYSEEEITTGWSCSLKAIEEKDSCTGLQLSQQRRSNPGLVCTFNLAQLVHFPSGQQR
jgi:hypothetical protein